jgi:hypothetical protein
VIREGAVTGRRRGSSQQRVVSVRLGGERPPGPAAGGNLVALLDVTALGLDGVEASDRLLGQRSPPPRCLAGAARLPDAAPAAVRSWQARRLVEAKLET